MAGQLRSIHQNTPMKEVLVSGNTVSDPVNIGDFEGPFSIQISWKDGSTLDYVLSLEVSNNMVDWVDFPGSSQNITGATGSHIYDIADTGIEFVRTKFVKNTGEGVFSIYFNGKGRV